MKPEQRIEQLIKAQKPNVETDGSTDDRVLAASFAAMEETRTKSASRSPSLMPKLATAAMIAIVAGLFLITHDRNQQEETPKSPVVTQSPAELLTAISLKRAYRRGGIEAVEEQCDAAVKMLGPRLTSVSVNELLSEFNGS